MVVNVALVALVAVLGAVDTLEPLRQTSAHRTPSRWWPALVYGPWMVAALSILRASIYRRHALHSWIVVLTFAALSMALSVPYASTDARAVVAAVLPATAITACLHQLVRQTTLTRPPLAKIPAQRRWRA